MTPLKTTQMENEGEMPAKTVVRLLTGNGAFSF